MACAELSAPLIRNQDIELLVDRLLSQHVLNKNQISRKREIKMHNRSMQWPQREARGEVAVGLKERLAGFVLCAWQRWSTDPLLFMFLVWAFVFLLLGVISVSAQTLPTPEKQQATTSGASQAQASEVIRINPITDSAAISGLNYRPLTGQERWHLYLNQNFTSVGAYLGVFSGALIDQAGGQPPEWGGGVKGYGRRVASRFAAGTIQGSIQSGGDALMGLEPRYVRSTAHNPARRIGHAFALSFLTYNNEGKLRLNLPNLGSYYASSVIATTWQPKRYTALGDGVRDGNRQVITGVAFNLVQEFWPEITRLVHRH